MIGKKDSPLTVSEECRLLDVSRAGYYYRGRGEREYNQKVLRRIDELAAAQPTWGSRMIRDRLREEGQKVNRKRIQRLMGILQIKVIYAKMNLSRRNHDRRVYPYLLKGITIDRPNQVWCTDIRYIRLKYGFVFLVAILDWATRATRAVLSYRISNTIDRFFCIEALEEALRRYGVPDIFNSDQGGQFTSPEFTGLLRSREVKDQHGRKQTSVG